MCYVLCVVCCVLCCVVVIEFGELFSLRSVQLRGCLSFFQMQCCIFADGGLTSKDGICDRVSTNCLDL